MSDTAASQLRRVLDLIPRYADLAGPATNEQLATHRTAVR
jgi:hypothetical protein